MKCQHGRENVCVRCDPWCPKDKSDEVLDLFQRWADQIHMHTIDGSVDLFHLPGGIEFPAESVTFRKP